MNLEEQPSAVFGRRHRGADHAATAPDARPPKSPAPRIAAAFAFPVLGLFLALAGVFGWALPARQALTAEDAQARQQVIEIVNQPVTPLPRTMAAEVFSPGWFHPGTDTPNFATADIRKTQDLHYADYTYVTSDLNPSEMFPGDEVEFNAMTKYFYADRTLPKKRLSEPEMLEINRLYRIIARDRQGLAASWETVAGLLAFAIILGSAHVFFFRRSQQP